MTTILLAGCIHAPVAHGDGAVISGMGHNMLGRHDRSEGIEMPQVPRRLFRRDIQGLRAVAVILVLLYHTDIPFLSGGYVGVDVFFVISGFLITSHLLAALDRDGHIRITDFYAKRVRRILPASAVVLVGAVAAGTLLLPKLQQGAMFQDATAAALSVPNLLFAHRSTDYLSGASPSLVQHYWSLGVEEQFYLVWPLLLLAGFHLSGQSKKRLLSFVAALVVVSFASCIYFTIHDQPLAYFLLPTRFWELGVGGLVAFAAARRETIPPLIVACGGWFGLAGIFAAGWLFDERTGFPGFAAALPVLGAALVIFFGTNPTRFGPGRLLGARALVFVGALSFSLYLVHWPMLVLSEQSNGTGVMLEPFAKLLIVIAAVPVAYLIHMTVERPFQPASLSAGRKTLALAAVVTGMIVLASLAGVRWVNEARLDSGRAAAGSPASESPVFTSYVPSNLQPTLRLSMADNPAIYSDGCHAGKSVTQPVGCVYGDPNSPLVELFGDSHAAQWFPALKRIADDGLIRLRVDTKSACPAVTFSKLLDGVPYTACDEWRATVIAELNDMKPDLVIISNYGQVKGEATQSWGDGLATTIRMLDGPGRIMVLADTPHFSSAPALCLSAHLTDTRACLTPRDAAIDANVAQIERAAAGGSATYVDLNNYICSARLCGPLIGRTLLYRDESHLTATFVGTLVGPLVEELHHQLGARMQR